MKLRTVGALAACAALMVAQQASALIITTGTGSGNTTESSLNTFDSSFPYWRNSGRVLDAGNLPAGGVYLGNQWVLTAAHVNAVSLTVTNASNATQVLNKDSGYITIAPDLVMFHVDADPGLASVPIRAVPLTIGLDMIVIGHGYRRTADEYSWRVDTDPATWVWELPAVVYTGTPPALTGDWDDYALGYRRDEIFPETKRWGTNRVEATAINGSPTFPTLFASVFDDPEGILDTPHEAQGTYADSGGGVFIKNGLNWELAGIFHTIGNIYNNQPFLANNPMFGNATFYSDLTGYRSSIMSNIPEPASLALLAGGAAVILGRRRRTR